MIDEFDEMSFDFDDHDIKPERDDLFEEAARLVINTQNGSTSLLQRKLKIGYNRAGRIINELEVAGILGPFDGSNPREVMCSDEIINALLAKNNSKDRVQTNKEINSEQGLFFLVKEENKKHKEISDIISKLERINQNQIDLSETLATLKMQLDSFDLAGALITIENVNTTVYLKDVFNKKTFKGTSYSKRYKLDPEYSEFIEIRLAV